MSGNNFCGLHVFIAAFQSHSFWHLCHSIKTGMERACGFRPLSVQTHPEGTASAQFAHQSEAAALIRNTNGHLRIQGFPELFPLTQGQESLTDGFDMPSAEIIVQDMDAISEEDSLRSAFYALLPDCQITHVKVVRDRYAPSPHGYVEFATVEQAMQAMVQAKATGLRIDRARVKLQYARRPASARRSEAGEAGLFTVLSILGTFPLVVTLTGQDSCPTVLEALFSSGCETTTCFRCTAGERPPTGQGSLPRRRAITG